MRWPLLIILAPLVGCAAVFWFACAMASLQRARDDHEGGAPLPKRESKP